MVKASKCFEDKSTQKDYRFFVNGYILRRQERKDKVTYFLNGENKSKEITRVYVKNQSVIDSIKNLLNQVSLTKYIHLPNSISSHLEEILKSTGLVN